MFDVLAQETFVAKLYAFCTNNVRYCVRTFQRLD